jgi:hypothetical protein
MRAVPDIAAVLAVHGITPGPAGYAHADLSRLAETRGWRAGAEPIPNARGSGRFRALVWQPADPRRREAVSFASRGRGTTEEEALAIALAVALTRADAVGASATQDRRRP